MEKNPARVHAHLIPRRKPAWRISKGVWETIGQILRDGHPSALGSLFKPLDLLDGWIRTGRNAWISVPPRCTGRNSIEAAPHAGVAALNDGLSASPPLIPYGWHRYSTCCRHPDLAPALRQKRRKGPTRFSMAAGGTNMSCQRPS